MLIAAIEDPQARSKLKMLLSAMGNPLANLLLEGSPHSFAAMDVDARVLLLRSMGESSIGLRRAGFQALKRLVNVGYYWWPVKDGSHPAWRA